MASEQKIRERILEIASRPKNVTLADIDWVMNQLKHFMTVEVDGNVHRKAWSLETTSFSVCTHHRGGKQIKSIYVKNFLDAMVDIGWYE